MGYRYHIAMTNFIPTIIIGAGAAGLFCAAQLGKLGQQVSVFDNGKKIGRKILMSGGGFCNFTNLDVSAANYLSQNPHFVKSALSRFNQWDFIAKVTEHGIPYHEKELGQLFCDNGAQDIVAMLQQECAANGVHIQLRSSVESVQRLVEHENARFQLQINGRSWYCRNLVIASGGLSMPGLGATPLGYQLAEQFAIKVIPPRAALVPFTYREADKFLVCLAGISLPVTIQAQCGQSFTNQMLFTHRGISGPAVLQISNYWQPNQHLIIDLLPHHSIIEEIKQGKSNAPKLQLKTLLGHLLPKKLVELWLEAGLLQDETLANLSNTRMENIAQLIHQWHFTPNGTEGYRTAEVTAGGVDTHALSSKTMQAKDIEGLFFIGEVLDVTGWLGGYNFQWAWSSAFACAQAIHDLDQ